jgi:hypothetical protein
LRLDFLFKSTDRSFDVHTPYGKNVWDFGVTRGVGNGVCVMVRLKKGRQERSRGRYPGYWVGEWVDGLPCIFPDLE